MLICNWYFVVKQTVKYILTTSVSPGLVPHVELHNSWTFPLRMYVERKKPPGFCPCLREGGF